MSKEVKIGTRGSKLALYQAKRVKGELEQKFPEIQFALEIIHTKGDKILDVALSKIGDKGLFTKEIEQALLDGQIDLAVHSMKDLPTDLPESLKLGAVLERGETREAFVAAKGRTLSDLNENDIIGTSSVRRRAQLLAMNPKFKVVDIRGNVETRLNKWRSGHCTATIMAAAGIQRLELGEAISELVDIEKMVHAPAQGIIAIETREEDPFIDSLMAGINHTETWIMAQAEYAFLAALGGGCQVPIACHSEVKDGEISITAQVLSPDGSRSIKQTVKSSTAQAVETAQKLAASFLQQGALEIIGSIERQTTK
ncbi:MAG: hydroxymethylbilane synthase [Bacteroidales bacterium]|nr:hydroxymethylbilane synthase [Bacteroidales bacterium]